MVYLDTNSLIRFFTKDDNAKAEKVKNLLESNETITIADVVFPELEYVLTRIYGATRESILKSFTFLASLTQIKLPKHVKDAIVLFEKTKLDIADCLIAAASRSNKLASFDRKLLDAQGVESYW